MLKDILSQNFKGARGRRKGQCIGVYSCNTTLANLDKRSREARLIRGIRAELTQHIGGNPSPVQRILIERAAMLSLRVALLDQKIIDGEILGVMDNNQYLAWSNSLTRTLTALGLIPAQPGGSLDPMSALRDHLAKRQGPAA